MSDEKEYFHRDDLIKFLEKDTQRILKRLNAEYEADSNNEIIFYTEDLNLLNKAKDFERLYVQLEHQATHFRACKKMEGFNLKCKSVEVVLPEKDVYFRGQYFHLKIIFTKERL